MQNTLILGYINPAASLGLFVLAVMLVVGVAIAIFSVVRQQQVPITAKLSIAVPLLATAALFAFAEISDSLVERSQQEAVDALNVVAEVLEVDLSDPTLEQMTCASATQDTHYDVPGASPLDEWDLEDNELGLLELQRVFEETGWETARRPNERADQLDVTNGVVAARISYTRNFDRSTFTRVSIGRIFIQAWGDTACVRQGLATA